MTDLSNLRAGVMSTYVILESQATSVSVVHVSMENKVAGRDMAVAMFDSISSILSMEP